MEGNWREIIADPNKQQETCEKTKQNLKPRHQNTKPKRGFAKHTKLTQSDKTENQKVTNQTKVFVWGFKFHGSSYELKRNVESLQRITNFLS